MKAIITEINNLKSLQYKYYDVAKFRDDCDAIHNNSFNPPIMVLNVMNDDGSIDRNPFEVYATPEIAKSYTGFDLFNDLETNVRYKFIRGVRVFHCYMIEFELKRMEYPHTSSFKLSDRRDSIKAPIVDYPTNLKEIPYSIL